MSLPDRRSESPDRPCYSPTETSSPKRSREPSTDSEDDDPPIRTSPRRNPIRPSSSSPRTSPRAPSVPVDDEEDIEVVGSHTPTPRRRLLDRDGQIVGADPDSDDDDIEVTGQQLNPATTEALRYREATSSSGGSSGTDRTRRSTTTSFDLSDEEDGFGGCGGGGSDGGMSSRESSVDSNDSDDSDDSNGSGGSGGGGGPPIVGPFGLRYRLAAGAGGHGGGGGGGQDEDNDDDDLIKYTEIPANDPNISAYQRRLGIHEQRYVILAILCYLTETIQGFDGQGHAVRILSRPYFDVPWCKLRREIDDVKRLNVGPGFGDDLREAMERYPIAHAKVNYKRTQFCCACEVDKPTCKKFTMYRLLGDAYDFETFFPENLPPARYTRYRIGNICNEAFVRVHAQTHFLYDIFGEFYESFKYAVLNGPQDDEDEDDVDPNDDGLALLLQQRPIIVEDVIEELSRKGAQNVMRELGSQLRTMKERDYCDAARMFLLGLGH